MIPVEHGQTCIFVIFSLFVIVLSDFTISLLFFVCVFFFWMVLVVKMHVVEILFIGYFTSLHLLSNFASLEMSFEDESHS